MVDETVVLSYGHYTISGTHHLTVFLEDLSDETILAACEELGIELPGIEEGQIV